MSFNSRATTIPHWDFIEGLAPEGYGMRLTLALLVMFSFSGCSLVSESWNFAGSSLLSEMQTDQMKTNSQEPPEVIVLSLDSARLATVELGQSKVKVLSILGPSANPDTSQSLADQYEKDGEPYELMYFRTSVDGVEDIRALLFKADKLVGIGRSEVD